MGNLGASLDEIAWVSTGYILASVVIMPLTGWLGSFFGRKRYFVGSIVMFTAASFFCGASHSLGALIFWRVVQGIGGGALMTVSQAVLFEAFPRKEAGTAMALFGLGVMVGPTIGPTLGGWLTDNYSWPWIFYINVPVGILAATMIAAYVHDPKHQRKPARDRLPGHRAPRDQRARAAVRARARAARGLVRFATHHRSDRDRRRRRRRAALARAHDGTSGDRLPRAEAPPGVGRHAARRHDGRGPLRDVVHAAGVPPEQSAHDRGAGGHRDAARRDRDGGLDGGRRTADEQIRRALADRDRRAHLRATRRGSCRA